MRMRIAHRNGTDRTEVSFFYFPVALAFGLELVGGREMGNQTKPIQTTRLPFPLGRL
jgi:hypothetical protein